MRYEKQMICTWKRFLWCLTFLAATLLSPLSLLPAEAAELQVIDSTEAPWPSIGRVNVAGYRSLSMCTGTLIAPNVVLTAAHCLYNKRTLKPFPVDDLLFIAGVRRDEYAARLEAACFRTLKGFMPAKQAKLTDIRRDAGIVILKEASSLPPIPPLGGREAKDLSRQTRFQSAGYRRSRRYLPTLVPNCKVLGRTEEIWITDCSAEQGASGGPLLVETAAGLRVAGIMSAKIDEDRSAIVPFSLWRDLLENPSCPPVVPSPSEAPKPAPFHEN